MANLGTEFIRSLVATAPGGAYWNYLFDQYEFEAEQRKLAAKTNKKEAEQRLSLSKSAPTSKEQGHKEIARCSGPCESKRSLLALAKRYGIYLPEGALKHSKEFIKQMIIASARHNILGFLSMARENRGLGFVRALTEHASTFADSSVKELVANDSKIGTIYLQDDKLSLKA